MTLSAIPKTLLLFNNNKASYNSLNELYLNADKNLFK